VGYQVTYEADRVTNELRALDDCIAFLGEERLHTMIDTVNAHEFKSRTEKYRCVRLVLAFVGIQGYWPARAVMRVSCDPMATLELLASKLLEGGAV